MYRNGSSFFSFLIFSRIGGQLSGGSLHLGASHPGGGGSYPRGQSSGGQLSGVSYPGGSYPYAIVNTGCEMMPDVWDSIFEFFYESYRLTDEIQKKEQNHGQIG